MAFLASERGIGKSSLASFDRFISERDQKVLGLHTFLGGVLSLEEIARRVLDRLLKESIEKSWEDKVKNFFGNHIRQVGVSVEFSAPKESLRCMVHGSAPVLRNLMKQLRSKKNYPDYPG